MKKILFLSLFIIGMLAHGQRRYSYNNKLGVALDATLFNLSSDDVDVTGDIGWAAGLETRGEFRHFADLIFGIQLFNNQFHVQEALTGDRIDMNVIGAELKFLFAYKPGDSDYISLEIGPALSFNGELKTKDDRYENSVIAGDSAVTIDSFKNTTPINFNGIVGFSAGLPKLRFSAHYHHAFLDVLNGKNARNEELNATMNYVSFGIRAYL